VDAYSKLLAVLFM